MKKFFKLFLVFTIGLCLMHAYPVQAQTTEELKITSFEAEQIGNVVNFKFGFNRELSEAEKNYHVIVNYKNEADNNRYSFSFSLLDLEKESDSFYYSVSQKFLNGIFEYQRHSYGDYLFEDINVYSMDNSFTYTCDQMSVCKPNSIKYTEEMNPLENLTEKDFYIENGYTGFFEPFRSQMPVLFYKDGTWLDTINVFDDIPTSGKGEITKTVDWEIQIASGKTKTFPITVTYEYSDEPDGIILDFQEKLEKPKYYEVTAKFDEFIKCYETDNFGEFLTYKVLLNDGTIIKEPMKIGRGDGPDLSTVDKGYLEGTNEFVPKIRYKYIPMDDPYLEVDFRVYLVDDNNNIVDKEGNILKAAEKREEVKLKPAENTEKGVSVKMKEGTLPSYTEVKTEEVKIDEVFEKNEYVAYDISMIADHVAVQPNGEVEVSVELPENLLNKEVEVYYVADDGSKEKVEVVGVKNGTVTFKTDHFSTYAIVATGEKEDVTPEGGNKPETNPDEKPGSDTKPDVKPGEKPQDKPEDKVESDKSESPKTGDNSMITMFGMMVVLSASLLVVLKKKFS